MKLLRNFNSELNSQEWSLVAKEEDAWFKGAIPSEITEEEDYAVLKEKKKKKRHEKMQHESSVAVEEDDFVSRIIMQESSGQVSSQEAWVENIRKEFLAEEKKEALLQDALSN